MEIEGNKAIIKYDPLVDMFRGEFIGLNGGADFYATNITELRQEGKKSLKVFLDMCKEEGLNPHKKKSESITIEEIEISDSSLKKNGSEGL